MLAPNHLTARAPFRWSVNDGLNGQSLLARSFGSEISPTFSRAGVKRVIDQNGVVVAIAAQVVPISVASSEKTVNPEISRTNLCLQSENFGTTWALNGTPTRVAASHTASGVTLDLIGDDDAGVAEGYNQTITFTADAVKAVSLFVKQGSSTSSVVRLLDSTAGANRLVAALTWSGGLPSVTASTGTFVGYDTLADGVFRLLFATTSVTAANVNTLQVRPATDAALSVANIGTLYAGGVQAENALVPSSYIPTTTATVTRAADVLYFTLPPSLTPPVAITVYVRFIELGGVAIPNARVLAIAESASNVNSLRIIGNGNNYGAIVADAAGATLGSSSAAATPARGQVVEFRALVSTTIQLGQSISGAAEVLAAASSPYTMPTAWGSGTPKIFFGTSDTSGSNQAGNGITHVVVAFGTKTLAEMRELAGV